MLRRATLRFLETTKNSSKHFWCLTNMIDSKNASRLSNKVNPCISIIHHFCSATPQKFTVTRFEPELVRPLKPTPRELKPLSDIDDQQVLRLLIPIVHFYRHDPAMRGQDPAKVIRDALGKALVFYYPFAGRLREGPGRKLSVDCTGEGVFFVEADADVELSHFGDPPRPPFPSFGKLLYHVPVSRGVDFDSPLVFIQVTRLKCGGFIVALRFNHTMSDALGIAQFLAAVGEMSRGARVPSVTPVWSREMFRARDPPRITCSHRQYDVIDGFPPLVPSIPDPRVSYRSVIMCAPPDMPLPHMIHRSFFFGPSQLQAVRRSTPRPATTFEALTAFLWRCYATALPEDDQVRLLCIVNARGKAGHSVPVGYYGNAFAFHASVSTPGKLCQRGSAEYALELVKKAKEEVTPEYMQSLADALVIKNRPCLVLAKSLMVSDIRRAGFDNVDFGWGKAVYAGPAGVEFQGFTVYIPFRNSNGEDGIIVPLCLPPQAMERFETHLNNMLTHQSTY